MIKRNDIVSIARALAPLCDPCSKADVVRVLGAVIAISNPRFKPGAFADDCGVSSVPAPKPAGVFNDEPIVPPGMEGLSDLIEWDDEELA